MQTPTIAPVERLDFRLVNWEWPFSVERRDEIATHFLQEQQKKPTIWNGRIFLLRRFELSGTEMRGEFFETGFAELLAWRDWGYPDPSINSAFSMAAIETADRRFLLGVMGEHTANAGKIYFPTGTPDADDLDGERVDLDRSVRRELAEETGLAFEQFKVEPHWHAVFSGRHIALIKRLSSSANADVLGARVRAFLADDVEPELSGVRFVTGVGDLTADVPAYVSAYLKDVWRA